MIKLVLVALVALVIGAKFGSRIPLVSSIAA